MTAREDRIFVPDDDVPVEGDDRRGALAARPCRAPRPRDYFSLLGPGRPFPVEVQRRCEYRTTF